jgi:epsin
VVLQFICRLTNSFTGPYRSRLFAPCRFRKRRHLLQVSTRYVSKGTFSPIFTFIRDNIYVIKTLKEFQYIDDIQKDQGANVRQKAKDITNLLQDDARLRQERKSRATMRDRMTGRNDYDDDDEGNVRRSRSTPPAASSSRPGKDDDDLKRAIEASKRSHEADQARQRRKNAEYVCRHFCHCSSDGVACRENDLEAALRLSREEEANRSRALEDANQRALFDDQNHL